MLTGQLIHPEILHFLSLCGHGSKILIADGNYPLKAKTVNANKIYLGLTPGTPTVTDVLKAVNSVANFEAMKVMTPDRGKRPGNIYRVPEYLAGLSNGKAREI